VYMKEVKDTFINCNLQHVQIEKEKPYKWMIFSAADPEALSDTAIVLLYQQNRCASLEQERNRLQEELGGQDNAINHFVVAAFYEQHDLTNDALVQYELCLAKAPDVDDYFYTYLDCLVKYGQNEKVGRMIRARIMKTTN